MRKQILAAAAALGLLLSLCACGGKTSGKIPGGTTATDAPETLPAVSASPETETPPPAGTPAATEAPTDPAAQESLDALRACMAGAEAAAAAYLGYRDESERGGSLTDWLWTNVPGLMEKMPFLQSIPAERVVNGDCGDLYCIVPRDGNTSLSVNRVVWRSNERGVWPETEEVLYRSEQGEPLLVFVRWAEFRDEPDVEILAVADGGQELCWHPVTNETDGTLPIPTGEGYAPLLLDFSRFGDLDFEGWLPPTAAGLAATSWYCGSWMLELADGGSDPDYAGTAALYCQETEGGAYQRQYSGVWRVENDCLRLELSAGVGTSLSGSFPVYIDRSGEHLRLLRDGLTHGGLPFIADDENSVELTLSFG